MFKIKILCLNNLVEQFHGNCLNGLFCFRTCALYSPRNDPDPEMIPNPEMIPKSTPK